MSEEENKVEVSEEAVQAVEEVIAEDKAEETTEEAAE